MKVSIILTVLNEGDGMRALLDALLGQTLQPDEIVIVDGGSRDETLQVLKAYAAQDPRIKVHVEPGVNIARGRNLAIARAEGDILAVTDGGCQPEPDWLRELLAPLQADPAVGAVAGRFIPLAQGRFEHYCGQMSVPDLGGESQRGMFFGVPPPPVGTRGRLPGVALHGRRHLVRDRRQPAAGLPHRLRAEVHPVLAPSRHAEQDGQDVLPLWSRQRSHPAR